MNPTTDADYLAARAAQHAEMAEQAIHEKAREVHLELSGGYASRAAALAEPVAQPLQEAYA